MTIPQIPLYCNVLWETAAGAQAATRGDMEMTFCERCGHIFNRAFDHTLMAYNQRYENSLHHSPRFQQYATTLVNNFVERYDVRDKAIVEIGAGQGDFLQMMCITGRNRGVGFDPSFVGNSDLPDYLRIVPDYYSEAFADFPADVILCRHVFEHIEESGRFLAMVRRIIGERSHIVTLFEVPNALWTIRELGIWDIIYEHCGYFSPFSLAYAFASNHFQIERIDAVFGGQFLTIEATPAAGPTDLPPHFELDKNELAADVAVFAAVYEQKVDQWRTRFADLAARGQKAVIWGAGSKGVTFLNVLNPARVVDYAVDINPRKKGMFVAGTGQPIVAPADLASIQPEVVIIMNQNYEAEISQTLQELGVSATILVA